MNGVRSARRNVWSRITTQQIRRASESQNGKKPLCGPSVLQPTPIRRESQRTRSPPAISRSAVVTSAVRMPPPVRDLPARVLALLLQETALGHQIFVELLVLLDPLDVLGARRERSLERAVLHVLLPFRRLDHLLEKGLVPLDGIFLHSGRAEDTA